MFIESYITSCDMTDTVYAKPVLGGCWVAQGATGRWCEVLSAGPEYIAANGLKAMDREEARAQIELSGNGWADFW